MCYFSVEDSETVMMNLGLRWTLMLITLAYLRVKGQNKVKLRQTVLIEGPFHVGEIISWFYDNSEILMNQLGFKLP